MFYLETISNIGCRAAQSCLTEKSKIRLIKDQVRNMCFRVRLCLMWYHWITD